jgi:hypothetical protein
MSLCIVLTRLLRRCRSQRQCIRGLPATVAVTSLISEAAPRENSTPADEGVTMIDTEVLERRLLELKAGYLQRSVEGLLRFRSLVDSWEAGDDGESLREIHVVSHRIHGGSALAGCPAVGDAAWAIERLVAACGRQAGDERTFPIATLRQLVARLGEALEEAMIREGMG